MSIDTQTTVNEDGTITIIKTQPSYVGRFIIARQYRLIPKGLDLYEIRDTLDNAHIDTIEGLTAAKRRVTKHFKTGL